MSKKTKFVKLSRGGYRLAGDKKNNFMDTVRVETPDKNRFDLSHAVKMTGKMGALMPCLALEVYPGDSFSLASRNLVRLAPMIAPVMDKMEVRIEYFNVPNRLIWEKKGANDGWEDFITNEGGITAPFITVDDSLTDEQKRFLDYFGIPPFPDAGGAATEISALPFAAYQMIYDEYYRAQYLESENFNDGYLVDGDNDSQRSALLTMRQRGYDHDYFTAALPTPQKGDAVDIPLGNITLKEDWGAGTEFPFFEATNGTQQTGDVSQVITANIQVGTDPFNAPSAYNPNGTLVNEPTTLNDLRTGEALQKWLEMFARVGSRFKEVIKGFFGIEVEDYRLDRPEYIVGSKSPVIISEVLNSTGEDGGLPQGNMAGHGVAVDNGRQEQYFCKEHGWIIGIISVMPKATYSEGIPRNFLRKSPNDYFWPQFAHLGEQATENQEIVAYTAQGEQTWGYMPRYAELRTLQDRLAGDFRSTLSYWTLGRFFDGTIPPLNADFLRIDPDQVTRIFAVTDSEVDYLYMHIVHQIMANRPIPVFGTPQLI